MKIGKITILFLCLMVSCVEPISTNIPIPEVSYTPQLLPSPSQTPVVFTPKKSHSAITGIVKFEDEASKISSNRIFITIFDKVTKKLIKMDEVKKDQQFI